MDFVTGNIVTYVLVAAYAVILVIYLWAESKNTGTTGFKRATALKLTLSSLFCVVGVLSFCLTRDIYDVRPPRYHIIQFLVVCALFCAWGGDYFLQYIRLNNKKYKTGIRFFMIAQIFLIANLCILNRIGWQEFVVMAVILLLVLLLMKKQDWKLGDEQKLLTAYTILLVFMASKAAVVAVKELSGYTATVGTVLMAAGAALFLLSDMFLGIWNYNTGKRVHANLNWITYFSGMMLIALSLGPEFMSVI